MDRKVKEDDSKFLEENYNYNIFKNAVERVVSMLHKTEGIFVSFLYYHIENSSFDSVELVGTTPLFKTSKYSKYEEGAFYYAKKAINTKKYAIGYNVLEKFSPWPPKMKEEAKKLGIISVISVPVIVKQKSIGVVNFFYSGRPLKKENVSKETIQIIANCNLVGYFLGQLIENIELNIVAEEVSGFLRHEIPHVLTDIEIIINTRLLKDADSETRKHIERILLLGKQARNLIYNIGVSQRWSIKGVEIKKNLEEDFNDFFERKILNAYKSIGVEFKTEFENKRVIIDIDQGLFERAIANIIQNAFKYSSPGSPIKIVTKIKDKAFEIIISNYGETIPVKERKRVFDKYHKLKLKYYRLKRPGQGLGLYITRRIIEGHGGEIFIAKPKNHDGCEVHILLPYIKYTEKGV